MGAVHARLWDAENTLRRCERQNDFGPSFVAAARAIIAGNGQRSRLKRMVNVALGSCLVEEKQYE